MTPILFPADAASFETQGLGALTEAISCEITEAINGEYELAMTYPASGRRYADIKNRCIIYAKPDPYRGGQPFRIYRITKPMNGVVAVYARHISYDLSGVPVLPFQAANAPAAMQGLGEHAAIQSPFTFSSTVEGSGSFAAAVPVSTRAAIGDGDGSILSVFGGELEWDGFAVRLLARRGQDTGVRIAYGKNLTGIEQDENIQNMLTGIIGYWADSESGTVVTSPVVKAPGTYDFDRIGTVDFSSDFDEKPTADALAQKASEYIEANGIGVPEVSISVSWVQLEQYAGGEGLSLLERVTLGDTVTVEFPALGVDATARVVKTVYDALRDRYTSADIGSIQANIANTIAGQQQEIQKRPTSSAVENIASQITAAILGAKGGAVRLLDTNNDGVPDTLYIADNPDPAQAQKVWRFNYEGWGASKTGYNGPFTIAAGIEDGLYADFITAGTLNCALLNVINLVAQGVQLTGDFVTKVAPYFVKLKAGLFSMGLVDENGNENQLVTMSATSIDGKNGYGMINVVGYENGQLSQDSTMVSATTVRTPTISAEDAILSDAVTISAGATVYLGNSGGHSNPRWYRIANPAGGEIYVFGCPT